MSTNRPNAPAILMKSSSVKHNRHPMSGLANTVIHGPQDNKVNHSYQSTQIYEEDVLPEGDMLFYLGTRARKVFEGDWSNLPPMTSNTVRIFISSTFSGMYILIDLWK